MAQLKPQDDYMKTALRLPRDLHAKIQEEAVASGRSMNAEIVARLEDSFSSEITPRNEVMLIEAISHSLAASPSTDYAPGTCLRDMIKKLLEQEAEQAILSLLQERGLAPSAKK